jgi:hypothetical protein
MSSARVRRRHGCAILLSIGQWEFGGAAPLDPPCVFPPHCKLFHFVRRTPYLHRQFWVPAVSRTIKGMRKKTTRSFAVHCGRVVRLAGRCDRRKGWLTSRDCVRSRRLE